MNPVTDNSTAQATTAQTDVNDDLAKALASVQAGAQDSMAFETVGEPALPGVPSTPAPTSDADEPVETPIPVAPVMTASPAPSAPVQDDATADEVEYSTPPANIDHAGSSVAGTSSADSIEQIKISALSQLRPLMQHIELSPEEKFEKYLMMLRASDDPDLIQPTYEAAQLISSEKLKAQALLDVINEINYLTSQQLVA